MASLRERPECPRSSDDVHSDATRREVADTVSVAETREVEVKGFDGLVPIHRVTAIDGSFEL